MTEKKPGAFQMSLGARLRTYFFAGVLITAPVSLTIYLAWLFITFVDERVFSLLPPEYNPETYLPVLDPRDRAAAGAGRPDADRRADRRHHRARAQRAARGHPQPAAGDPLALWRDQADHGNGAGEQVVGVPRMRADRISAQGHLDARLHHRHEQGRSAGEDRGGGHQRVRADDAEPDLRASCCSCRSRTSSGSRCRSRTG